MGQPVVFFEVLSTDYERAQSFYRELFNWKINVDPALGGYGLVDTGAGEHAVGGGIGPPSRPGVTGVKFFVQVDDLDAYLDRAEALGGKRAVPPTDLPGELGRYAIITDPDGNDVGLWHDRL
jgi:predicted enzyme related to lactoylglutathione lyase